MSNRVFMLGLQSRLNPTQLGGLDDKELVIAPGGSRWVDAADPSKTDRVIGAPIKMRAHSEYPVDLPVTARPDEPAAMLAFIERWTEPLRPFAGNVTDRRFIFATGAMRELVVSFAKGDPSLAGDALARLCERAEVPRITPQSLRLLGIDLVHERSDGDPMTMRAAGNWADLRTGVLHYFGAPARRRDRETVGMALLVEERRRVKGISVTGRPAGADLLSSTDGWRCGNPFDSPVQNEGWDGLCAAVGLCPICPHVDVGVAAPAWSLTRIVALLGAAEAKVSDEGDEATRSLYRPVPGEILDLWLPLFPRAIVEEARHLPACDWPELPDAR